MLALCDDAAIGFPEGHFGKYHVTANFQAFHFCPYGLAEYCGLEVTEILVSFKNWKNLTTKILMNAKLFACRVKH